MGRKSKGPQVPSTAAPGANDEAATPEGATVADALASPAVLPHAALGMLANPAMAPVLAHHPALAGQLAKQALALAYQASAALPTGKNMFPEVEELMDHYGLDERITKRLDDELKKRTETYEGDIAALWDILDTARNPSGLLAVKIQEMQAGTFIGKAKLEKDLAELVRKFKLDETAATKLAGVLMGRRERRKEDLEALDKRLETSNKPSAMVMMLLPRLRSGEPVGEPDRGPAPGSYADLREQRVRRDQEDRRRGRSSDRRRGTSRSCGRRRRSRSRSRRRRRSRS